MCILTVDMKKQQLHCPDPNFFLILNTKPLHMIVSILLFTHVMSVWSPQGLCTAHFLTHYSSPGILREKRERERARETEQCSGSKTVREPHPILRNSWHDSLCIQHGSKASAAREVHLTEPKIVSLSCSKKLKKFAKIIITFGCCQCIQTTL